MFITMFKRARYMEIVKDERHTSKINSKQIRLRIRMVIIMLKIIGNDNETYSSKQSKLDFILINNVRNIR